MVDPTSTRVYRAPQARNIRFASLQNPNEEHMGSSSFGEAALATTGKIAASQTLQFVHDGHGFVRFGGRA